MSSEDPGEISLSELLKNPNPLARNPLQIGQSIFYDPNEEDFHKILQTLQFQCEQENEKLNKLRSLTEYFQQQNQEMDENKKRITLLMAEEQLLSQEIEKQRQYQQNANTRIRVLGELSVRKHVHETVKQYKKALPQLIREVKDTKEQITRERETLNLNNAIHQILSERLEQLVDKRVTRESEIRYGTYFLSSFTFSILRSVITSSSDLRERLENVQNSFNELIKELNNFVEQNFEKKKSA
ncbi:11411_t:CDS:2 [Acaulospora colombiana]|uniref:11411_t:CDS:1 n=1 Tax=Acaulospora colombiana TaxID=27376 RepID=A0ACA9JYB1_9GLOM|nr:11411_t:CDS:2 [Acaulospora colombiana]